MRPRLAHRSLLLLGVLAVGLAGCFPGSEAPVSSLDIEIVWDSAGDCVPSPEPDAPYPSCSATGVVTVTNEGPDATFGPVVLTVVGGVSSQGDQTLARLVRSTCGQVLDVGESCQADIQAIAFDTDLNGVVGTVYATSTHASASEEFVRTTG